MSPATKSLPRSSSPLHAEERLSLIAGPTANDESAAFSIDLLIRAVQDAKSNAKLFVDAGGFHYLAWLLARVDSAPDVGADTLLARVRAADLAARVCEISQWYLDAALEVHVPACHLVLSDKRTAIQPDSVIILPAGRYSWSPPEPDLQSGSHSESSSPECPHRVRRYARGEAH